MSGSSSAAPALGPAAPVDGRAVDPALAAPLLEAELTAGYGSTQVLGELRFALRPGEALGLVGTSGSGKSTLLLALLGLLPWKGGWAAGRVLFEGTDLLAAPETRLRQLRGRRFALIPQSPLTALNGVLSLGKHFEYAWRAHARWDGAARQGFDARVAELMAAVHLPADRAFLARKPGEISVGQAQRVLIAMALLHRPTLLLADEPTSALDPVTQAEIVALLRRIHREEGTSLLYISHDLASVLQLCDRAAVLVAGQDDRGGSIAETLSIASIEEEATHPATRRLLAALPAPPAILRSYRAAIMQP